LLKEKDGIFMLAIFEKKLQSCQRYLSKFVNKIKEEHNHEVIWQCGIIKYKKNYVGTQGTQSQL
jgi:hypothetical protein